MIWKIYSWTGLSPACSPTSGDLILAIADNEAGERIFVRVYSDKQNTINIGMIGSIECEKTENGEITIFIPES